MKRLSVLLLVSVLACGGDDDKVQTGVFSDSPVLGLHYATKSQSGLTDASGTFKYKAGETVTFSLGGITLGSAAGASKLTPMELFGTSLPATAQALRAAIGAGSDGTTAFSRAVGVAMFLQRFDADGDASNGIDLSGLDTAFAGASFDFDRNLYTAQTPIEWLATKYAITEHRFPYVDTTIANLYASAGISMDAHVTSSEMRYAGTSNALTYAQTITLDSQGHATQTVTDDDGDGTTDVTLALTYDADGNLLTESVVSALPGVVGGFETATYDAAGHTLTESYGNIVDGAIAYKTAITNTFGAAGNGLTNTYATDNDGDGVVDHTSDTTTSYDSEGRPSVYTSVYKAAGVQTETSTRTLTYDAAGNNLTSTSLYDFVASTDELDTATYTYDDHHHVLSLVTTVDYGADGSVNAKVSLTTTYDASGRILTQDSTSDSNNDGVNDRHTTTVHTYDAAGNRLTNVLTTFDAATGAVTKTDATTYTYDANDNELTEDNSVTLPGGALQSRELLTFTYDADGYVVEILDQTDSSGSGAFDGQTKTVFGYTTISNSVDAVAISALE